MSKVIIVGAVTPTLARPHEGAVIITGTGSPMSGTDFNTEFGNKGHKIIVLGKQDTNTIYELKNYRVDKVPEIFKEKRKGHERLYKYHR